MDPFKTPDYLSLTQAIQENDLSKVEKIIKECDKVLKGTGPQSEQEIRTIRKKHCIASIFYFKKTREYLDDFEIPEELYQALADEKIKIDEIKKWLEYSKATKDVILVDKPAPKFLKESKQYQQMKNSIENFLNYDDTKEYLTKIKEEMLTYEKKLKKLGECTYKRLSLEISKVRKRRKFKHSIDLENPEPGEEKKEENKTTLLLINFYEEIKKYILAFKIPDLETADPEHIRITDLENKETFLKIIKRMEPAILYIEYQKIKPETKDFLFEKYKKLIENFGQKFPETNKTDQKIEGLRTLIRLEAAIKRCLPDFTIPDLDASKLEAIQLPDLDNSETLLNILQVFRDAILHIEYTQHDDHAKEEILNAYSQFSHVFSSKPSATKIADKTNGLHSLIRLEAAIKRYIPDFKIPDLDASKLEAIQLPDLDNSAICLKIYLFIIRIIPYIDPKKIAADAKKSKIAYDYKKIISILHPSLLGKETFTKEIENIFNAKPSKKISESPQKNQALMCMFFLLEILKANIPNFEHPNLNIKLLENKKNFQNILVHIVRKIITIKFNQLAERDLLQKEILFYFKKIISAFGDPTRHEKNTQIIPAIEKLFSLDASEQQSAKTALEIWGESYRKKVLFTEENANAENEPDTNETDEDEDEDPDHAESPLPSPAHPPHHTPKTHSALHPIRKYIILSSAAVLVLSSTTQVVWCLPLIKALLVRSVRASVMILCTTWTPALPLVVCSTAVLLVMGIAAGISTIRSTDGLVGKGLFHRLFPSQPHITLGSFSQVPIPTKKPTSR